LERWRDCRCRWKWLRFSTGPIALQRTFSGELEALAEFVVAPKVSGRVVRVLVNIADTVKRGQVVAELDNDEYVQAVAQAQADLEVARANLSEARSALEIANREFKRTESLLKRGIASDSEFDAARQDQLAKQAQLKVAEAQVTKAESSLETANIRLGYTKVTAGWTGGNEHRVVAERYVDEGQTVAANAPAFDRRTASHHRGGFRHRERLRPPETRAAWFR
jgi:RND family efflux transporter MFP subunit